MTAGHKPYRHRLPDERAGITHKFNISGHEGYLNVGLYPNGTPGEIFIRMSKEGSTVSGLMDAVALLTSLCLQYNVPLEVLVDKFAHGRFEPQGHTQNKSIGYVTSPLDYIFRWLKLKFLSDEGAEDKFAAGLPHAEVEPNSFVLDHAQKVGSEITAAVDPLAVVDEASVEYGESRLPSPTDAWWCPMCTVGYGDQDIEKSSQDLKPLCPKCGVHVVDAGKVKGEDDEQQEQK